MSRGAERSETAIRPATGRRRARCGAMTRRQTTVQVSRDAEPPTLPTARRQEHGSANAGRTRGESPRAVDARRVFAGNEATPGRQSPPMAGTLRVATQHPVGRRSASQPHDSPKPEREDTTFLAGCSAKALVDGESNSVTPPSTREASFGVARRTTGTGVRHNSCDRRGHASGSAHHLRCRGAFLLASGSTDGQIRRHPDDATTFGTRIAPLPPGEGGQLIVSAPAVLCADGGHLLDISYSPAPGFGPGTVIHIPAGPSSCVWDFDGLAAGDYWGAIEHQPDGHILATARAQVVRGATQVISLTMVAAEIEGFLTVNGLAPPKVFASCSGRPAGRGWRGTRHSMRTAHIESRSMRQVTRPPARNSNVSCR